VDGVTVQVAFAPGEGRTIDALIARELSAATQRIKVSSMMLTSHTILGALSDALAQQQVPDFAGVYDRTQMASVVHQWEKSANSAGVLAMFQEVAKHMASKKSHPFRADSKHDFMHNKVAVCDDTVITGSFNFSRSATQNAENVLVIEDKSLADRYSDYIDELVTRYKAS